MDDESALQRKIELQAPEDLAFLVANVRRAARERLDEAFPLVDGGEDELRNGIAELVEQFIEKTFSLAAPNLTINGLPVPSSLPTQPQPTAYEPFDGRKRRRVADLVAEEEKLLEEVAALKRTVPSSVAAAHAARLRDGLVRDEALLRTRVEGVVAEAAREDGALLAEGERQRETEEAFRNAVETLARLKRDLPAVVAKMERAVVAGEYVVADKR
ncbi:hypothetical protein CDD80_3380 [Ophiocordyceps camponoti-rufipedis]|uniref:Kinetochore protein mis14 n=1 Tax=Ophiocordyceps camponoti-rufipedis TaxID=2004952 RepID=A0A2C5YPC0_9HYPO|nr:hypothetical protein CDD80_3380 [Ophiocordyceps camponoti-rufipedis]